MIQQNGPSHSIKLLQRKSHLRGRKASHFAEKSSGFTPAYGKTVYFTHLYMLQNEALVLKVQNVHALQQNNVFGTQDSLSTLASSHPFCDSYWATCPLSAHPQHYPATFPTTCTHQSLLLCWLHHPTSQSSAKVTCRVALTQTLRQS